MNTLFQVENEKQCYHGMETPHPPYLCDVFNGMSGFVVAEAALDTGRKLSKDKPFLARRKQN